MVRVIILVWRSPWLYFDTIIGTSKTIYQRTIKKVYDKERGAEIIEALHNNPAVAIPVVLKRLKQKDEEWKRAQV